MNLYLNFSLAAALCAPHLLAQPKLLKAGQTSHEIVGVVILEKLPKVWTQPRFAKIAAEKAAPTDHVYVVVKGKVTNSAAEERNLTTAFVWLEDRSGTKYRNDGSGTVIYQPAGTGVSLLKVPPGATKPWVAFFPVPKGASGMKLIATDLKFRDAARAELPLPDALPGKPATATAAAPAPQAAPQAAAPPPPDTPAGAPLKEITTSSVAGVWTLDEPFSKQAADGNTAGLMKRVTVMPDGTFVAMYGIKGKWKVTGGKFLITFDGSAGTRSDEVAALTGNHVKWPSPSDRRKFCYMRKL